MKILKTPHIRIPYWRNPYSGVSLRLGVKGVMVAGDTRTPKSKTNWLSLFLRLGGFRDLSNIATNIYLNNKRSKNKSKVSKELEDILNLPYRKAVYLLQIRILKMLKKAYPLVSQKAEPTGPMSSKSCEASGF